MHELKEKYLQHLKDINYSERSCENAEHHLNRFLSHLQTQGIEKIQNVTKEILIESMPFLIEKVKKNGTLIPQIEWINADKDFFTASGGEKQNPVNPVKKTLRTLRLCENGSKDPHYSLCVFARNTPQDSRSLSSSSIYSRFKWIRQFFEYLEKERIVLLNPAEKVPFHKMRQSLPSNIMTKEEILEFFSIAATTPIVGVRDRAILELLYSTGLRRQELVNLNIYDVNFGDGILFVRQGKGKRDRFVPVGKEALQWLERYLREVRPMLVERAKKNGTLIKIFLPPLAEKNKILLILSKKLCALCVLCERKEKSAKISIISACLCVARRQVICVLLILNPRTLCFLVAMAVE